MKKLFGLAAFFMASFCMADDFYYCPDQIECSIQNDISSCAIDDHKWKNITHNGRVQKGVYSLSHIWSSYDSDRNDTFSRCLYSNKDGAIEKTIWFDTKGNWEASLQANSKWMVTGDDAQCADMDESTDCPMIAKGN